MHSDQIDFIGILFHFSSELSKLVVGKLSSKIDHSLCKESNVTPKTTTNSNSRLFKATISICGLYNYKSGIANKGTVVKIQQQ
jgi:hypothetical protein